MLQLNQMDGLKKKKNPLPSFTKHLPERQNVSVCKDFVFWKDSGGGGLTGHLIK